MTPNPWDERVRREAVLMRAARRNLIMRDVGFYAFLVLMIGAGFALFTFKEGWWTLAFWVHWIVFSVVPAFLGAWVDYRRNLR